MVCMICIYWAHGSNLVHSHRHTAAIRAGRQIKLKFLVYFIFCWDMQLTCVQRESSLTVPMLARYIYIVALLPCDHGYCQNKYLVVKWCYKGWVMSQWLRCMATPIYTMYYMQMALLAQSVEHFHLNWEVLGSNPGQVKWAARLL